MNIWHFVHGLRRTEEILLKVAQKHTKVGEVGPKEYKRQKKRKDIKIGGTNHFMAGFFYVLKKLPAASPGIG